MKFHFEFTNPATNMLLGLNNLDIEFAGEEEGEILMSYTVFSIGLFFCRFDFIYNEYFNEKLLNDSND
jgi:hypothetical protein